MTYRCTKCSGIFAAATKAWELPPECPHCAIAEQALHRGVPGLVDSATPGLKFDHGKPLVVKGVLHYFPRAIEAVAGLSEFGATKYSWEGWRHVPNGIERYREALVRHVLAEQTEGPVDPETGLLHATAVAWNALASLELLLRNR